MNIVSSKTVTLNSLPKNLNELKTLKEAALTCPFEVAVLTVAALCRYCDSPQDSIDMLNYLRGPRPLTPYDVQFLRDRLRGKPYKPISFLGGTSPENGYTPSVPYSVTVLEDPYARQEENYIKLFIRTSGADAPRLIKMRTKPSTGQWFLWEQYLLPDIRIPVEQDPWA